MSRPSLKQANAEQAGLEAPVLAKASEEINNTHRERVTEEQMEHRQEETPQPTSPAEGTDMAEPQAQYHVRKVRRPHVALRRTIRPQEMFALVGGFALYGLLLFTISANYGLVIDVYVVAALVFLLYPFRHDIVSRRVMQLGVGTFLLWLCTALTRRRRIRGSGAATRTAWLNRSSPAPVTPAASA